MRYRRVTQPHAHLRRAAGQGIGSGYSGFKGLNALIATASTPLGAPVILATRLRKSRATAAAAPPNWSPTLPVATRAAGPHGAGLVLLRVDWRVQVSRGPS